MDADAKLARIIQRVNKLEGMPKIYYINLDTATDRNQYMLDMFAKSGITNFERYEARRYPKSGHRKLNSSQFGCMMSHIAVCKLIADGNDEYAIIAEDDIDFSAIDQWEFTWKEFIERVPKFDTLQLVREQLLNFDGPKLKEWDSNDRSCAAYVITKRYARSIVSFYNRNKQSLSGFPTSNPIYPPVADESIYCNGTSYSVSILRITILASQIAATEFDTKAVAQVKRANSILDKPLSLDDVLSKN